MVSPCLEICTHISSELLSLPPNVLTHFFSLPEKENVYGGTLELTVEIFNKQRLLEERLEGIFHAQPQDRYDGPYSECSMAVV